MPVEYERNASRKLTPTEKKGTGKTMPKKKTAAKKKAKAKPKKKPEIPPRARASDVDVWCRHDELADVTELIENPRNPNKHPDKQIALLAKIIKAQGWRQPITVSNRSGFIVKGHGRLHAARLLQVEQVPVEHQDYATEAQEYADLIADNRIAELAEPDDAMLAALMSDDLFDGFDLDLTGFDALSLGALLGDDGGTEGLTDPDDVPEDAPPVCQRGQVWKLGDHRLMCGDSTDSGDVGRLMDGTKADMVFTDPPYNVDYGNIKHPKFKVRNIENDNMSKEDFNTFCEAFIDRLIENCDGCFYVWAGVGADSRIMFSALDRKLHCSTTVVWNKDQFTLGRGKYQNKWESCWFGWNKDGAAFTDDRTLTNVWDFKRHKASDLHPTMKPIDLCEHAISHASKTGDAIIDLFIGSGSTLIACEKTGRVCFGMELDPKYCDVIIKRWEDFTGLKAELIK